MFSGLFDDDEDEFDDLEEINSRDTSIHPKTSPDQKVKGPVEKLNVHNRKVNLDIPRTFDPRKELNEFENIVAPPPVPYKIDPLMSKIPILFRKIFPFPNFNRVQTESFPTIFEKDTNCVISAPTSSGKTALLELAIVRVLMKRTPNDPRRRTPGKHKAVYIGPLKALCQEKLIDWKKKFGLIGFNVEELTGDTGNVSVRDVRHADILTTTPEKWDSVTRKWRDWEILKFVRSVELVLIDEVHLLNEKRGAALEVVIGRMKTISREAPRMSPVSNLRIVAISATIPNIQDIGRWLGCPPREGTLVYGKEYRPCPLQTHVKGYKADGRNEFLFLRNLNFKLPYLIGQYSDNKPTIVFCSTRKDAQNAAVHLSKERMFSRVSSLLRKESRKAKDNTLRNMLARGVAFHTAGLDRTDRSLVENLFLKGHIKVVCSTSTLSQGINLPAHLVIIKGTMVYRQGIGYVQLSPLVVQQMCGRAGRPQFDEYGVAVIMTEDSTRYIFENLLNNRVTIESHLLNQLVEHINSEIVLRNINSIEQAVEWVKSTFLYIRLQQSPEKYNFQRNIPIDVQLHELMKKHFSELLQYGLIERSMEGQNVRSTVIGRSMCRFYVAFDTMKAFARVGIKSSMGELLEIACSAKEFEEYPFRRGEKGKLNALKKKIRFKFKGRIKDVSQKVSVLVQCGLDRISIKDINLNSQSKYILNSVIPRILRCMLEYCLEKRMYETTVRVLKLWKCVERQIWDNSEMFMFTQVPRIGDKISTLISRNGGVKTLADLERMNARRIEAVCRRAYPFGSNCHQFLKRIDRFMMTVQKRGLEIDVKLTRTNQPSNQPQRGNLLGKKRVSHFYHLLVGDSEGNMVDYRKFPGAQSGDGRVFTFRINQNILSQSKISVSLIHDHFVGVESHTSVNMFPVPVGRGTGRVPGLQKTPENKVVRKKRTTKKGRNGSKIVSPPKQQRIEEFMTKSPKTQKGEEIKAQIDFIQKYSQKNPVNVKSLIATPIRTVQPHRNLPRSQPSGLLSQRSMDNKNRIANVNQRKNQPQNRPPSTPMRVKAAVSGERKKHVGLYKRDPSQPETSVQKHVRLIEEETGMKFNFGKPEILKRRLDSSSEGGDSEGLYGPYKRRKKESGGYDSMYRGGRDYPMDRGMKVASQSSNFNSGNMNSSSRKSSGMGVQNLNNRPYPSRPNVRKPPLPRPMMENNQRNIKQNSQTKHQRKYEPTTYVPPPPNRYENPRNQGVGMDMKFNDDFDIDQFEKDFVKDVGGNDVYKKLNFDGGDIF